MSVDTSEYLKYKGQFPKNGTVFAAMLIDLLSFNFIMAIILKIYGLIASGLFDKYTLGRVGFVIYVLSLLLIPILSAKAQTLGQFLTKTKIKAVNGGDLPIHKAILRWVYSVFSPVGYSQKPVPWYDFKTGAVMLKKQ